MDQVKDEGTVGVVSGDKEKLQVKEEIEVPLEVAIQAKMSEYDRAISQAEFEVAKLKKDRADFLHDQNLNLIKRKYQKSSESKTDLPSA